ncbi:MAG: ABC transporter ATP-binding protein, partial [Chloroflexi bacterium]
MGRLAGDRPRRESRARGGRRPRDGRAGDRPGAGRLPGDVPQRRQRGAHRRRRALAAPRSPPRPLAPLPPPPAHRGPGGPADDGRRPRAGRARGLVHDRRAGGAVLPPLALVVFLRRRRLRAAQLDYRDREGGLAASVTESMRNISLIQAFGLEPATQDTFATRNRATALSGMGVVELNARYQPTADVIVAIGSALVLWVGVTQVISGRITLGMLVVVVSYVASLYAPVRALARLSATFGKAAASRTRLSEIVACDEVMPERPGAPALAGLEHELTLRSVSFAYSPDRPVLHRVGLRVPAGATFCIVGPTGAGKSTLLSLMLRLYDPDEGSIEVDGRDLRAFDLRTIRRRMSLVPQEPAIFDATLRENIALGSTTAGEPEVRRAARLARLDEFASGLPAGYDTPVGEGGVLLSGGQRRRLAIARALVREAPVLLLDEPTSGL